VVNSDCLFNQPTRAAQYPARKLHRPTALWLCKETQCVPTVSNNAVIQNARSFTTPQTFLVDTENRLVFINLHFVKVRTSHTADRYGQVSKTEGSIKVKGLTTQK